MLSHNKMASGFEKKKPDYISYTPNQTFNS